MASPSGGGLVAVRKVADYIADFLEEKSIKTVFGIIGSGNAQIFDAIHRKGYTQIVCMHHEQAALMAMITYTRTTGTVSAGLLTTGAGSTNGVTGVVSAWMDSVPGLIISGNENSKFTSPDNPLRIWGIQGYDSTEMVSKVTKYSNRVLEPKAIRLELAKAFDIATTGRPGPIWLDVPMNVQAAPVEESDLLTETQPVAKKFVATATSPTLQDGLSKVSEQISRAERPVLWVGNGIRLAGAQPLLRPLVEKLGIPTLVSWAGIDMIASDHPLVFGRAGIYGQRAANFVLQNADFVLAIGTRLAMPQVGYDISEIARAAKTIAMVDIDPAELSKYPTRINLPICSDALVFIKALLESAPPVEKRKSIAAWTKRCDQWRDQFPFIGPEHADKNGFINSYQFMDRLSKQLKPDQIIVTDMGTALLSGHQALSLKEGQRLMTSTGLGEMGFGLPGAIGASFARGQSEVLCLNCDGGMMMNLQELQTVAHHKLPIKIVIFNNDGYLMIKHTQGALFEGRRVGVDKQSGVTCPDFSALAKAFGFAAYQIRTWDDFDSKMTAVMNETGPTICEVFMDPNQLFVPKLSLAPQKDGSIVSPPIEDLSPLLQRSVLKENMIVALHPKSELIKN
jgi:acetolactate synthase I/II/III large subunit